MRACLYEGYLLWPYRRSALKNAKRWTFGTVFLRERAAALGEPSVMRTQMLFETGPHADPHVSPHAAAHAAAPHVSPDSGGAVAVAGDARLPVQVRFLHVAGRRAAPPAPPAGSCCPCQPHAGRP